jgi:hypothetical protein
MGETAANEQEEYWYNINTKQAEVGKQSAAIYRIGPFASFEEATNALEIVRERASRWKEEEQEKD